MNILIIGLGYKGLSLALYLADRCEKSKITGFDINRSLLNKLKKYDTDFAEKEIRQRLKKYLNVNLVLADSMPAEKFDLIFICVGVQFINGRLSFDNFMNAVCSVKRNVKKDSVLIVRRNLPVGFTRKLVVKFLKQKGFDIPVVFAPERTNRELALAELGLQPQMIGADTNAHLDRAKKRLKGLFPSLVILKDLEAAEFTILCNHFHTFWLYGYGNAVSDMCSLLNFNTYEIIAAANKDFTDRFDADMKIRPKIHNPGFIGGSGLNIDILLLLRSLRSYRRTVKMIAMLKGYNDAVPEKVVAKCLSVLKKKGIHKKDLKIGIAGFGYKGFPPTSDYRFSLATAVLNILKNRGFGNIFVHDPVVSRDKVEAFGVKFCDGVDECFKKAGIVFMLSDHGYYKKISVRDYGRYISNMDFPKIVFDACNILDMEKIKPRVNNHFSF